MKIIGVKLNQSQMLSIKGGSQCMVCRCTYGGGPFYSMNPSPSAAEELYRDMCDSGTGIRIRCSWGPGDGKCPAIPE